MAQNVHEYVSIPAYRMAIVCRSRALRGNSTGLIQKTFDPNPSIVVKIILLADGLISAGGVDCPPADK